MKDNRDKVNLVKNPFQEIPEMGRSVLEQKGVSAVGGIIL